jgi:hypothetical protein
MELFKGIIHVHSNFSYDGQHSIEEIAQLARRRGYSFIGMSEHSDTFDAEKTALYVKECRRVSHPDCLIIPGFEFTCENNLHLIGLGVHSYTDAKDPLQVSEFIQQKEGVAIVSHPKRYNYQIPMELAPTLNGIEVWNAGYDGRFVPNDRSLNLLKDFRKHNRSIFAFGGQDLHRIADHSHVKMVVSCEYLQEGMILRALQEGNFVISNPYFQLDVRCEPGWLKSAQIIAARRIYDLAKRIRDRIMMMTW